MPTFYSRESGADGFIRLGEGVAPGTDLATLLARGRPPVRAALEVGAALADILSIAEEDNATHGDIKPGAIKIDESGTVSIEGYGTPRRTCRAPEARPMGIASDVYMLGITLHALLASQPMGMLPRDHDSHDEEVVHRVMAMDFEGVEANSWIQDVRHFLAMCMAYDPSERPRPLDVANLLAHISTLSPGEDLNRWASRSSATARQAPVTTRRRVDDEDLGGPITSEGPLSSAFYKGSSRQAPAAKGESTEFWTLDRIRAMTGARTDAPPPPAYAGTRSQRPQESLPPAKAAPAPPFQSPNAFSGASRPAVPPPVRPPPPVQPPPSSHPAAAPAWGPPPTPPPVSPRPLNIQGPVAPAFGQPAMAPLPIQPPAPQPAPKNRNMLLWVLAGLAGLALLCGVPFAGGAIYYLLGSRSFDRAPVQQAEPTEDPATEDPATEDPATEDPATEDPATETPPDEPSLDLDAPADPAEPPAPENAPSPPENAAPTAPSPPVPVATAPKVPAATPTPTPAPPKATPPRPTARSSTEDDPRAMAGESYEVKFTLQGQQTTLKCGDGQSREFVGTTRMTFSGVVTCMVLTGGARTAVQTSKASTVTCTASGGTVQCSQR